MKRAQVPVVSLVVMSSLIAACGGGGSPAAPAPTPAPTPVPLRLTFAPATTTPIGAAMAIYPASRGHQDGMISLAITAHNLVEVYKVRGELRWNPAVLDFDSWGQGEFFNQGGAIVDWTFYTTGGDHIALFLDRPSTLPGASGSGEIFLFRLKPRPGVRSGQTAIQWSDPRLYNEGFRARPLDNVYGGVVTIQ